MHKIKTVVSKFFPKITILDRFSSVVLFFDLETCQASGFFNYVYSPYYNHLYLSLFEHIIFVYNLHCTIAAIAAKSPMQMRKKIL